MGQLIRENRVKFTSGSDESSVATLEGNVFGHLEFVPEGAALQSGNFQILVSTLPNGDHFEAARDANNAEVAEVNFDNTNRVFNVAPETFAVRRVKIKLGTNASSNFEGVFTGFTNE